MRFFKTLSVISVCVVSAVSGAQAAPEGLFSSCGVAPKVPDFRLDTVAHFNAAIDQLKKFQLELRQFDTCVIKQARKSEEAVSADARKQITSIHAQGMAIHDQNSDMLAKISARFKDASAKLKKG